MLRKGGKKIDRSVKNAMRTRLEQLVREYQQLGKVISQYRQETDHEAYQQFWNEVQGDHDALIQKVSRYMLTHCNR